MDNETPSHGWQQRGTKRSYAEIDSHPRDRSRSISSPYGFMDRFSANEGPSQSRLNTIQLPPLQRPSRWSGDGFDFRRPVRSSDSPMSSASSNTMTETSRAPSISVIDLTNEESPPAQSMTTATTERRGRNTHHTRLISPPPPPVSPQPRGTFGAASRGPRYAQEIIDLSADSPEATTRPLPQNDRQTRSANTQTEASRSPEVEFLRVRPVLPAPPGNVRQPYPDPFRPNFGRGEPERAIIDDDDDVEITGQRLLPGAGARHLLASLNSFMPMLQRVSQGRRQGGVRTRLIFQGAGPLPGGLQFEAPSMDFRMAGFDLGFDMGDRADTASPPIVPPSAAPEGFTRSPAEGDELICPNCEEELCKGDSDLKKQVWIVKACGHVYCGECTANRAKSKRGRASTKPFKACVVEGCNKKTTHSTSMIQVYL